MEYLDIERVQHELNEVFNLWLKVKSEPLFSQGSSNSIFTDFINPEVGQCTFSLSLIKKQINSSLYQSLGMFKFFHDAHEWMEWKSYNLDNNQVIS